MKTADSSEMADANMVCKPPDLQKVRALWAKA